MPMTYKAFCESNENPILNQSDETVQSAVYDWFKYRYIGFESQEKFLDILQRNVKINYPMYQQKLRIEPGISQYDWLVSVYRERQLKSNGENSNTRTHGDDTTKHGLTVTTTPTGTETVTQSGNEIHTKTGGHLETGVDGLHTQTTSPHVAKRTQRTGTTEEETVAGLHTQTTSPHVQRVTSNEGGDSAWSGDSSVQATLPMSKSYSNTISPGTDETKKYYFEKAYDGMPATESGGDNLDWSTVSAQAQSGHREYHDSDGKTIESYVYGDGVTGDIVTTQGDATDPDKKTTKISSSDPDVTQESYVYDAGYEGDIVKSQGDTTSPDTRKVEYNGTLADGTQGERDTTEFDGRKSETSFTDRKTVTENSGVDTNTFGNVEDKGNSNRTDREQVTGRNEDPATLLARATTFIEQSSAFMWLKEQIDSCFMPGFYTDDSTGEEDWSVNI